MKNELVFTDNQVTKYFQSELCFNRELLIYKIGLPYTPKLIDYSPENDDRYWICIERVYGQHPQPDCLQDFVLMLSTLIYFHRDLKALRLFFSHADTSPKNFILAEDKCYLIDFAEISLRQTEYDIVAFFLFAVDFLSIEDFSKLLDYYEKHFSAFYRFDYNIILLAVAEFDQRRAMYKKTNIISVDKQKKREMIGRLWA